jgi:hypothetical protein
MPAQVERLLWRFKNGFKSSGAASQLSTFHVSDDLVAYGEVYIGASATNYTYFSTTGRQNMRGTARVRKDIWIPARDFNVPDLNWGPIHTATCNLTSACWGIGGSLFSGSVLMNVTGSIFASTAGSSIAVPVLIASANVSASKYGAVAVVPVPPDADTSGSITPYIEWTQVIAGATSNCAAAFYVGAAYLRGGNNTPSAVGTAACVEYAASYGSTNNLEMVSTTMPNLPSFGANDKLIAIQVGWDPNNASDTAGSEVAILGVRLRYTASALGVASAE